MIRILSLAFLFVLASCMPALTQININKVLNKTKKKTERKVESRIERRIDKNVDKTLNNVEETIDGNEDKTATSSQRSTNSDAVQQLPGDKVTTSASLIWNKFDFVQGPVILFEDNLTNEQNGEFPSRWDLKAGVVENAVVDGSNVIYFREMGNVGGISPLIREAQSDYLPDEFTVEFDCFFEANKYNQRYCVFFYDTKRHKRALDRLVIYINKIEYGSISSGTYPDAKRTNIGDKEAWKRISISFNKRALKIYMDDARLINIPNVTENPTGITFSTANSKEGKNFLKNVRIAKGAVPLYDKLLTDGKFVTNGITFDVNKAIIKPESSGTINYVVDMMKAHPDLKFSVEGHTDCDGDDAFNQKLSEQRAQEVVRSIVLMGIDPGRLTGKGFGESKPISPNNTPEGKATNRRVEFVKL